MKTKRFFRVICAIAMFIGLTHSKSVFATTTDWQDLGGGKARMIAILEPATNKIRGAIEIKLDPGWATYWRYPGSAGIPPQFDFSASSNLSDVQVAYPAPTKLGSVKNAYAGYKKSVVFPFSASVANRETVDIKLDMLLGVCEEICIPAKANFEIKSASLFQSDPIVERTLTFASLKVPKTKSSDELAVSVIPSGDKKLKISLQYSAAVDNPTLFVEGPYDWNLVPASLVSDSGGNLEFDLDISRIPEGVDPLSQKLRYTLTTGTSGIEFVH